MAQDLILPQRPPVSLDPARDPLTDLRDIHIPDAVPFWPPAPGWLAVAGLVLALVLLVAFLEWRRRQTLAYRALQAFAAVARAGDTRATGAAGAVVIRRILLSRDPHSPAAAFTGEAFARFLGAGAKGMPEELGRFLAVAPYLPPGAPEAEAIDCKALAAAVRRWIRSHA
ncbi:DUF4381 domain-containing protein [Xanthobacter sp. V4C-4]|uniref:DUF4381 domain-containing protein n=1 Tax=Xanthobacter cornucopiae TaxID=3119924 RepID=UPI003728E6E5